MQRLPVSADMNCQEIWRADIDLVHRNRRAVDPQDQSDAFLQISSIAALLAARRLVNIGTVIAMIAS
ncbi:hypothetical protein B0E45_17745 [Sinorhizobium sp. A49]|nr:hypothetical protein B0E45_17745 [Sinorhizobium sp. A49]